AARASEAQANAPTGIAHTRWATHGGVTENNAHPHYSSGDGFEVCVVHNGIIENHESLRRSLRAEGYEFQSDTDTEVIAHRIHHHMKAGAPLFEAVRLTVGELEGAYAIAAISSREPGTVVGSRRGSPLLLGIGNGGSGKGENFLASDTSALLQVTRHVSYLEEGDVVEIRSDGYRIVDAEGKPAERAIVESQISADAIELGHYDHYMQKEIFEQPGAIANTLEMLANANAISPGLFGAEAAEVFKRTRQRVPLPRLRLAARHPGGHHLPVGRDGRHPLGAAARQDPGPAGHAHHLQRARVRADPPEQAALPDPRGTGDRRRLDKGLHHPARVPLRAEPGARQAARPPRCGARARAALPAAPPARRHERGTRVRGGREGVGRLLREEGACALPR